MVDLEDPKSFYNKDFISPSINIFHSYACGKRIDFEYLKKHLTLFLSPPTVMSIMLLTLKTRSQGVVT
jgi:hypothetical protein